MARSTLCMRGLLIQIAGVLVFAGAVTWAADCNNNGVSDQLDITSGFSRDCNLNLIPDECEIFKISFGPATAFASVGNESESLAATWLNTSGATLRLDLNGDTFTDVVVLTNWPTT